MTGQELRKRRIRAGVSVKRLSCLVGISEVSLMALESMPPRRLNAVSEEKLASCNDALQRSIATSEVEENARGMQASNWVPPFLRF
jgi:transcriptional regulator with XRE-family HTH domain